MSKQTYITFIIDQLNKGNVKYNDVCLLFCTKFDLTKQTFNKYWKIAQKEHIEQRESIEKAKLELTAQKEITEVKTQIKTKEQLLKKLNEIIDQKAKWVEGQIIMPSYSDVRGAIDMYCKILGYFQATRVEHDLLTPVKIVLKNKPKSDDI